MSSRLIVTDLTKHYDAKVALEGVSLTVEKGTLTALTGPSGSGKTTLLKIVAGFMAADRGTVIWDPVPQGPPAVLVFQDNLLFPHLRVLDNVTFGPRARKVPRVKAEASALELLESLGIGDKARSWPGELSAGQQQRVALARALASEPAVLLLDEPFANLDRGLRLETARFVRQLQQERGLTVLLVTHGQEEAFAVADRVAYLRRGRLIQEGNSEDFRLRPADLETAQFTGEVNQSVDSFTGSPEFFRAAETQMTPDAQGEGQVVSSDWTGHGFRTHVQWRGAVVTVLGSLPPPKPETRVNLMYQTLKFEEKP